MPPAKKTQSRKAKDKRSERDKIIDAALDLAAAKRWRDLSMSEIAEHAGVGIGATILAIPSRTHILKALIDRIDQEVLTSLEADPLDGTTKDKLFDLLMRRFDALQGHRDAMASISSDLIRDPISAACLGGRFLKSMALTLQAAGASSEGCSGHIRAKALGLVQINAARAWLKDESEGLEHTMSTLDKGLQRAEKLAGGEVLA